ncbi:hypothetical protein [Teredinibacter turnerae]|uniref:hypothetical protein n=1 Tax=Teredinibacter turnerae TaxID=2426 RepID=UPI00037622D2|nr:hypothetical protein [Teredinibacter turnerae]
MSGALDIQGEITSQDGGNFTSGAKTFGDSFGGSASEYLKQKTFSETAVKLGVIVAVTLIAMGWLSASKKA